MPRRRFASLAVAVAVAAGAAVGCADGGAELGGGADSGAGGGETTTTTAAGTATTTTAAPRGPVDGDDGLGDEYYPALGNSGYEALHYSLELGYNLSANRLDGRTTMQLVALDPLRSFHLDLTGLEVSAVRVEGDTAEFRQSEGELRVEPSTPVEPGRFEVVVEYGGEPEPIDAEPLGPVGWRTTSVHHAAFVTSSPQGASTFFPVNDHPSDKATYSFAVTVADGLEVVANGEFVLSERAGRGTTVWRYEAEEPMASYLVTVHVADLVVEESVGPGGIVLRNRFPAAIADRSRQALARTGEMITFYSENFGSYPFSTYGAAVVDEDLGLALETQTVSTFGSDTITEPIVAHELAHQWFGNSVSLERWQDIWLNEGFASYAEWMWTAHAAGADVDTHAREVAGAVGDGRGLGPPPGDPGPEDLFAASVYERGALTLHALRRTVGDDIFFTIMRAWTTTYAGSNATTDDFVALAEQTSGQRLGELFDAWLFDEAMPALPD